jgi:hypothetical protein
VDSLELQRVSRVVLSCPRRRLWQALPARTCHRPNAALAWVVPSQFGTRPVRSVAIRLQSPLHDHSTALEQAIYLAQHPASGHSLSCPSRICGNSPATRTCPRRTSSFTTAFQSLIHFDLIMNGLQKAPSGATSRESPKHQVPAHPYCLGAHRAVILPLTILVAKCTTSGDGFTSRTPSSNALEFAPLTVPSSQRQTDKIATFSALASRRARSQAALSCVAFVRSA